MKPGKVKSPSRILALRGGPSRLCVGGPLDGEWVEATGIRFAVQTYESPDPVRVGFDLPPSPDATVNVIETEYRLWHDDSVPETWWRAEE